MPGTPRDDASGWRAREGELHMSEIPEVAHFEAGTTQTGSSGRMLGDGEASSRDAAMDHRANLARRLTPDAWIAILVLAAGVALRAWPLGGGILDYDEGVYWESLRAMALGHPLFSAVFSSQPPIFLLSVYPFYLLFGHSLWAARLGIAVLSIIGLAALYMAGRASAGRMGGIIAVAVLALDPLYLRESHTLQAEVPALALALISVAMAAYAVRAIGSRRRWLAATSGLILAFGIGAKLLDAVALVPVVLYLLAPAGAAFLDSASRPRWPGWTVTARWLRAVAPDLLACAGGLLAGIAVTVLPFMGQWPALYDQVVRFHMVAGQVSHQGLRDTLSVLLDAQGEWPLEAAALILVGAALVRRQWAVIPPALWACASLAFLLLQHPLLPHHLTVLIPPLALATGVAAAGLLTAAPMGVVSAWRSALAGRLTSDTLAWALVALVVVWSATASLVETRHDARPSASAANAAAALASVTQPGDLVVTDDQAIAGLADRDVPPDLVDTSLVRIQSGYLSAAQLEAAVQQPGVRAILFYSGRFNTVPGFREWVAERYVQVGTFGGDTALYLKLPRAPQPV